VHLVRTRGAQLARGANETLNNWRAQHVLPSGFAGDSVTLTRRVHDDNYPSDPTYAQFDGVVVF
jgi:hypothetical protein